MAVLLPYTLLYAPQVKTHLQVIAKKYHSLIRHTIEDQLLYTPDEETQNKKPLRRPAELAADWELRWGPDNRFRVFYSFHREQRQVFIIAIGVKERNRLIMGREEISL